VSLLHIQLNFNPLIFSLGRSHQPIILVATQHVVLTMIKTAKRFMYDVGSVMCKILSIEDYQDGINFRVSLRKNCQKQKLSPVASPIWVAQEGTGWNTQIVYDPGGLVTMSLVISDCDPAP